MPPESAKMPPKWRLFWRHFCSNTGSKAAILQHPFGPKRKELHMQINDNYLDKCPDIMSKEQFRLACGISKRTALYYLQAGLIPHISTGKGTHKYLIRKTDVINFLKKRSSDPQKYLPPENWYKFNTLSVGEFDNTREYIPIPDAEALRGYYTAKLCDLPDVLSPDAVSRVTGYDRKTINNWASSGRLRSLMVGKKRFIPKCYLVDWLCSPAYNSIGNKTKAHINALREIDQFPVNE